MEEKLVSIVLPIYNVEKYLNRCLESVVNQTYKNLEIILVDDGSTDGCPAICDDWAKRDERIMVIHKQNAGLGMARNTGIENATGDFICFYDSDDYIEIETIQKCVDVLEKNKAELVCYGLKNIDRCGKETGSLVPKVKKLLYSGEEVLNQFLPELIAPDPNKGGCPNFRMSAWSAVYSLKLIKTSSWRFVSEREIIAEDVYSLLGLYNHVNKVVVLPEALYCYCENDSSLSRSYKKDRYQKIKFFYQESLKLANELNYSEDIKHRISEPYLAFTIAAMKQEVAVGESKSAVISRLKTIIKDDLLQSVLRANKKDRVSRNRKLLFLVMRAKLYSVCYILLKAKIAFLQILFMVQHIL